MGDVADHIEWAYGSFMADDMESFVKRRKRAKRSRDGVKAVRQEHGERLNAQHEEAQQWEPSGHPAFSNTTAQDATKRRKNSTMKTKLELRNIAASVSDELVTIRCTYNNGNKLYTFICPIDLAGELKKGDFVVVSTKSQTYDIVQIETIDNECDLDDLHMVFQWVICKVDVERHDALVKWHNQVGDDLHKQQRKAARKVMLEQMNVDGVAPLALTTGVSGDVIDADDSGK